MESSGRGSPILLVHGWPLDHRIFSFQRPALSEHLQVVAYDRRGFGRSRAQADMRLELDDIDEILNALSCETVHLLGMSQGARIALRYAAMRPSRLRSLIVQSAVVDGFDTAESEAEKIPIAEFAELARAGQLDVVRTRWLQHPMMALDADQHAAAALLKEILGGYRGADLMRFAEDRYAYPEDVLAGLAEFHVPALIVTGTAETGTRWEHARKLIQTLPHAQLAVLEKSGHLCNLTEPAAYNDAIIRFCRQADN